MVGKSTIIGYHPVGAPTCLCKQEVGKPSQNAAQPCAEAEGCVHDDLRADKLRKGWGFRSGTWNVDSLTGRAGELVEALADRESGCGMYSRNEMERQRLQVLWSSRQDV